MQSQCRVWAQANLGAMTECNFQTLLKNGCLADKMKEGQKKGNTKPGSSGKPSSIWPNGESGEGEAQDILDIYKEQRQLRESLQNELQQ
jgi:hypothetical protein